jgi:hypothetical protein
VQFSQREDRLEIVLPPDKPDPDVSVVALINEDAEEDWVDYSVAGSTAISPQQYIRTQAVASGLINLVLNGLIALFSYRTRGWLSYSEVAIDIVITVAIIAFLVSWIAIVLARSEVAKGNVVKTSARGPRLPAGTAPRAAIIAVACAIGFGGLILDGGLYLLSPDGLSNWAYVATKTLYTGICAALAAALAIVSVLVDGDAE